MMHICITSDLQLFVFRRIKIDNFDKEKVQHIFYMKTLNILQNTLHLPQIESQPIPIIEGLKLHMPNQGPRRHATNEKLSSIQGAPLFTSNQSIPDFMYSSSNLLTPSCTFLMWQAFSSSMRCLTLALAKPGTNALPARRYQSQLSD